MDQRTNFDAQASDLMHLARGIARRLSTTPDDADDVAQEAVARAAAAWDRISLYARPWVVRVATNLCIDRRRDANRVLLGHIDERRAKVIDLDARIDIERALLTLPVRQRQVIVLRLMTDLSERDVAERLGCSTGAVKRHLHRAKRALREELAASMTDGGGTLMRTWEDLGFIEAVERPGGWPERPWDHRFVEGPDGTWDRVAVDKRGEPVVDADGDEVMSGPGFEHAVVKIVPGAGVGPPSPAPSLASFDAKTVSTVSCALDEAAVHGHPWVGDEHLALALSQRLGLGSAIGTELSVEAVDGAVAAFYEGPWAAQRLAIVRARRSGEAFVRPSDASVSWTDALKATLDAAAGPTTLDVMRSLFRKEHCLPLLLLGYAGVDADDVRRRALAFCG